MIDDSVNIGQILLILHWLLHRLSLQIGNSLPLGSKEPLRMTGKNVHNFNALHIEMSCEINLVRVTGGSKMDVLLMSLKLNNRNSYSQLFWIINIYRLEMYDIGK